jgi:hypothetical protein
VSTKWDELVAQADEKAWRVDTLGPCTVASPVRHHEFVPENERRIPFRNMIYIGDGLTDVPCMKLVKSNNGQSIAVFNKCEKITASRLMAEERVNFITEADYTVGSELDGIVKTIIEKISVVEKLERLHDQHKTSINEPERGCDDR